MANAQQEMTCAILKLFSFLHFAAITLCTDINLTLHVGNKNFAGLISTETRTWFEAYQKCKEVSGNYTMENANPQWPHLYVYSQFLTEQGVSLPALYWTGFYRPSPSESRWYQSKGCGIPDHLILTDFASEQQCAAYRLISESKADLLPLSCTQKLPYLCFSKYQQPRQLMDFSGYALLNYSYGLQLEYRYNQTKTECDETCLSRNACGMFVYSYNISECIFVIFKHGYGFLNVTLIPVTENVVSGLKTGNNSIAFLNDTISQAGNVTSMFDDSETFPDCGTENRTLRCECETKVLPDREFTQMITNMTISIKNAKKYIRTLTCAEDSRTSSSVFGIVGIGVILGVIGFLVLSDIANLVSNCVPFIIHKKSKVSFTT